LIGREQGALASRDGAIKEGRQPTLCVLGQPAPDGVAIHTKQRGHLVAMVGLPTGEELEGVQALLLGRRPFAGQVLFEFVGGRKASRTSSVQ